MAGSTCRVCGQHHSPREPHVYDYVEETDEDLTCQICLQPLVFPVDLRCGHTFCHLCIHKHLLFQKACPVDRKPADWDTCSKSSLVLIKVLEKLMVRCPAKGNCGATLQRADLKDHLEYRCPALHPQTHMALQLINNIQPGGITRLPVLEGEVSHIEIPRFTNTLGIAIVGGSDTALRCIVVQEIFTDGLVAQDGRLKAGDQLVEINGVDMTTATHNQACQALKKLKYQVLRLGVYRERILPYNLPSDPYYEIVTVTIKHTQHQTLGIHLSNKWQVDCGIYISGLVGGSPAARAGLCVKDKILYVNDADVTTRSLQQVSSLLQRSDNVKLVVSRKRLLPLVSHSRAGSAPDYDSPCKIPLINMSASCDSLSLDQPYLPSVINFNRICNTEELQLKHVTIVKQAAESLGMRISGGIGSNEGDTPIYIANIQPNGCTGKTQQIWKGDILLMVKENSLVGLTHSQAVATLKAASTEATHVEMSVIRGPETSLGPNNFVPSWLYWQKLPRCLQFPKTVVLARPPGASLGFSIVGGEDPTRAFQHIHILFVVEDSPAAKDGKLKCGDRLLSVDGQCLEKVEHSNAVNMLKKTGTKVVLEVVSWLGTEL